MVTVSHRVADNVRAWPLLRNYKTFIKFLKGKAEVN